VQCFDLVSRPPKVEIGQEEDGFTFSMFLPSGGASAYGGTSSGAHHSKSAFDKASARARIAPAVTVHILRHTHGSHLAMNGVPMGVIAAQLGHADTRMTEKHYAHLAPSYIAQTIRANFPILGAAGDTPVIALRARNRRLNRA
jgi:hypothetical protein